MKIILIIKLEIVILNFDITVRKTDGNNFNFTNDPPKNEVISLVKKAFAYCLNEGTPATNGSMEIKQQNSLGQVSTIMGALTSKDGDLLSYFDKNDEIQNGSNNTSLK